MRPVRRARRSGTVGVVAVAGILAVLCVSAAGCGGDSASDRVVVALPTAPAGDVIALRMSDTDPHAVEWIDRRAGTIRSVLVDGGDITTIASIPVGTDGEQRGLLGQTVIDGVRYAAWTDPDSEHLLVGALGPVGSNGTPGAVERIVWDAGGTAGGAVGGHLERSDDGHIILGIGQLTAWAKDHGRGAMLDLDPAGSPDQQPVVISDGYINPFAFTVADGALWVADNAVGDDVERVGRGDLGGRDTFVRSTSAERAPSAMVALPDGRLGVCGFLDGKLRPWSPTDPIGYGDAITDCTTGAAVLADGTLVTVTAAGIVEHST